tara:strand:+ start:1495 stop:2193 length:699 start_codon:yes stop_codon:yes gene_type:complete
MLQQRLGLSLPSLKKLGSWSPSDETSLVAWYQNRVGITTVGALLAVSEWADSSGNGYNMVQADATERPTYDLSSGALTFVSSSQSNIQTASQISLTADFTLGLRIDTSTTNGAFLADNTSSNEFFKYSGASNDRIALKIAGSASTNLDLDSGTFGDDHILITRVSNVITLWQNSVEQTGTTPTVTGTSLIDTIGIRRIDTNGFDGTIKEVQIYSTSNVDLTARVNLSLKDII